MKIKWDIYIYIYNISRFRIFIIIWSDMLHGFSKNNGKSVLDFYGQRLCNDHLFCMDGLDKENYNVCRPVFLGCNFLHGCQNNNTHPFLLYLLCSSIHLNPSHQSPSSLILLHLYLHTPIIHYSNTISTIITYIHH